MKHLFARRLRVTLLRYYLGTNQILILSNPKRNLQLKEGIDRFYLQIISNGKYTVAHTEMDKYITK